MEVLFTLAAFAIAAVVDVEVVDVVAAAVVRLFCNDTLTRRKTGPNPIKLGSCN